MTIVYCRYPVQGRNGTLPYPTLHCTESHEENIQISTDFVSGNNDDETISIHRYLNILIVTFSAVQGRVG